MLTLKAEGEISADDLWDSDFDAELKDAVQRQLEAELTGDESAKEVHEIVRGIIDREIG